MDRTAVLKAIESWPLDDQIDFMQLLWDRLAEKPDAVVISASQRTELERRLTDHLANPNQGIPWEEVKARALGRIGQ